MQLKRKKLLYVVEAFGGGVFTYIVAMANQLINEYDVYIAYAIRMQTPNNFEDYFDKRVQLIEVKSFQRSVNPLKDIKALYEIKTVAKKIQPDIIHLHSSKAGVIGRLAFNGHKIPVFYTPHGYSFLMTNQSKLKRTIYRMIEKIVAFGNCTTISCSKGEHRESLKLTNNAVYVNNGIDIKELQTMIDKVDEIKKSSFTVFTLGRICYQKNPQLFNKIAKAMPNVHFLWIGDGELKGDLSAENIEITGWLERKEALERALSADVFLLTSLWEGLPLSLLEAMYMRKICIVSDVIGNRDVICSGENGFVCSSFSEYVDIISSIKESYPNLIADTAFSDIENEYNTIIMAKRYRDIYNSFLPDMEKCYEE